MYFEIFQKFKNSLKNPKLKETPNNNKDTKNFCSNIRLMNPGDPSYGKIVEAIDKLKVFSGMKVFYYYNTINIGMRRYYYMTIFNRKYKINLKIELVCEDKIPTAKIHKNSKLFITTRNIRLCIYQRSMT